MTGLPRGSSTIGCLLWFAACGFPRPPDIGGDSSGIDAATTNGSPDTGTCFGSFVTICLASTPTMPFTVSTASNVDTDSPLCASTVSGATNYCVIAATNITIGATLRATGKKPLVLIATDSIVTTALLDVGSYRDTTSGVMGDRTSSILGPAIGAGANPSNCAPAMLPMDGGGYAGGSFIGFGGVGGTGSNGSTAGSPAPAVTDVPVLRGGCSAMVDLGLGGYGGGAVLLIAGKRIDVQGGIHASGASGRGAAPGNRGGFGGGAGGMIAFDAPTVTGNSLLLASGGGGGGGSSGITSGGDGQDPTTLVAAAGGGGANGGNGGNGSTASTRAAPGAPGAPGSPGGIGGGGGGGGGGAGLIKAPATANLGTMVSPPPTP